MTVTRSAAAEQARRTISLKEQPMGRQIIHTERAPRAIGTYSQAVRAGDTVYLSGQVPLDPATMQLVSGDIEAQIRRVFENLKAVAEAAGGSLEQAVKMNVYLTDLAHFAKVNEVMAAYCAKPYPARAAVGVAQLPRGAQVEIECVLHLG
jgi:reactive intermediate/imine deaminase